MAVETSKNPLITPDNAALLIIDYQPVQVTSVASVDRRTLVENVTAVAKTAKLFGLPVVLSTVNVATGFNKPLIHQIAEQFPGVEPIDRTTLNAWEDDRFRAAVEATGRKKLILCGLWTEVCVAFPAISAMSDGYEVYPVVDAMGSTSHEAHKTGVKRMVQSGARPLTWTALICELQRDWARSETASTFAEILFAVEGA